MFLVDDDEPQVFQGGEEGGTRSDDHAMAPLPDAPPLVVSLSQPQAGMEHRHRLSQGALEPLHHLRRESDLRHQHDGGFTDLEDVADGPQVDLGFATAGYSVQQERTVSTFVDGCPDLEQGRVLVPVEDEFRGLEEGEMGEGIALPFLLVDGDEATLRQGAQAGVADGAFLHHLRLGCSSTPFIE